jgi:glycosyltransferase involved in cell wall biosynthesis
MRILFLNHNLAGNGTWFRVMDAARRMVKRGHQASLYTVSRERWYRPTSETIDGVRVHFGPNWNPWLHPDEGWNPLDIAWRTWRCLWEECDLVYAFAHPPCVYLPARLCRLLRRKPVVVDWCDLYQGGVHALRQAERLERGDRGFRPWLIGRCEAVEARFERWILDWSQGVTVISSALERQALEWGVPPERIMRLPSWARLDLFQPMDKKDCRRALGLDPDGVYLVYVANYNPDERLLLDALRIVFERHRNVRLVARSPRLRMDPIRHAGVEDRIVWLDRMPDEGIARLLSAADANLLPMSDTAHNRHRWPHKFGDYLASGRPVLSNRIGDTAAFFGEPESPEAIGIAAAPDAEDYARAITRFLERPDWWERMGGQARRSAEESLSGEKLMERLEAFLSRVARIPA